MISSEIGKEVIKKELTLIPKLPGVYRMLNEKGDILGEDIPFFNFYMPNECWTDIIMGIKKSATSR